MLRSAVLDGIVVLDEIVVTLIGFAFADLINVTRLIESTFQPRALASTVAICVTSWA